MSTDNFLSDLRSHEHVKEIPSGGYFIHGCRVTLESVNENTIRLVDILNLCERGTGRGSRALRVICDLADECSVRLTATVRPYDTGLDKAALHTWYARAGFRVIDGDQIERLALQSASTQERTS